MRYLKHLLLLCAALLLLPASALAAQTSIFEHPTVGILPFSKEAILSSEWTQDDIVNVLGIVHAELNACGKFDVISREPQQMRAMVNEYYLSNTGLIDQEKLVEAGHLKGAEYLLMGHVDGITTRRSETSVLGAGTKQAQVTVVLDLQLIDTETGQVVLAAVGHSKKKNTLVRAPLGLIRIGTDDVDKTQVLYAFEDAVYDAISGERGIVARMEGRAGKAKRR